MVKGHRRVGSRKPTPGRADHTEVVRRRSYAVAAWCCPPKGGKRGEGVLGGDFNCRGTIAIRRRMVLQRFFSTFLLVIVRQVLRRGAFAELKCS